MATVVYHVEGEVKQGSALEPFVSAVLPLLSAYGVRVSPEQFARAVEAFRDAINPVLDQCGFSEA